MKRQEQEKEQCGFIADDENTIPSSYESKLADVDFSIEDFNTVPSSYPPEIYRRQCFLAENKENTQSYCQSEQTKEDDKERTYSNESKTKKYQEYSSYQASTSEKNIYFDDSVLNNQIETGDNDAGDNIKADHQVVVPLAMVESQKQIFEQRESIPIEKKKRKMTIITPSFVPIAKSWERSLTQTRITGFCALKKN